MTRKTIWAMEWVGVDSTIQKKNNNVVSRYKVLRAYSKAIKVIESIENEGQWETGYRMVEIFGERFLGDWVNPSLDLPFNRERHNELLSLIRIKYKALKRKQTVR
jgi:hypothetical protein